MPLRTAGVKAGLACLMLVWTCRAASGSTTLLRTASKMTPELGPVQTYAGNIDAVISSVKPAPAITIVLLTDSQNNGDCWCRFYARDNRVNVSRVRLHRPQFGSHLRCGP